MWNLGCTPILAGGDDAAIAIFVMGGIVAVVSVLSYQWRKHREVAYNARLKQLMIERGMTADEIERVVQATQNELGQNGRKKCDRITL
jgi:hypothetical protein